MFKGVRAYYVKHKEHIAVVALLSGFIIDNMTLTRIDRMFDIMVLSTYLLIAGVGIIVLNYLESRRREGRTRGLLVWLPVLIQFVFGGLFSGYFVFYYRSGSLAGSWVFLLLLAGLLVGNEICKKYYARFVFQVSIFFVAVYAFTIFFIPIILGRIGIGIFLLSGLVSLFFIRLFIRIVARTTKQYYVGQYRTLHLVILLIFGIINILYFTNSIPPIPLSLKDAGVYHRVQKLPSGNYSAVAERRKWYEFYKTIFHEYRARPNEPAYFYSAVFSPSNLSTVIVHRWQKYDESDKKWVEKYRLAYTVIGGRGFGYRAYSIKEHISPGKWRVDVMTIRGQILGRYDFRVIPAGDTPPVLYTVSLK